MLCFFAGFIFGLLILALLALHYLTSTPERAIYLINKHLIDNGDNQC